MRAHVCFVLSLLFVLPVVTPTLRAQPAATAPPQPQAQEARVAELERKLEAALARVASLENEVRDLTRQLADAKATPPSKPVAARKAAAKAAADGALPKGAKVTGTFTGDSGPDAVAGTVLSRSPSGVVLRLTHRRGTFDFDIRTKGSAASLAAVRTVNTRTGDSASFTEINVSGTIDADGIRIGGSWRVKSGGTNKPVDVRLDVAPG